jgi:hypothetical protein
MALEMLLMVIVLSKGHQTVAMNQIWPHPFTYVLSKWLSVAKAQLRNCGMSSWTSKAKILSISPLAEKAC